ncbi:MAG: hypothetical protein QNJ72_39430 [Pleurocapsa sp. MO_226.B13]|nr:hypothetical protein [Pleurocapsa sp. MO_226.B13]
MNLKKITLSSILVLSLLLGACQESTQTPNSEGNEDVIEDAGEDASDAIEDAGEDASDAIEDAGEDASDAIEDANN